MSLSEPANSGKYRGEPRNLLQLGIWTVPTDNLTDALWSKNSFCKRRRQYEEEKGDGCKQWVVMWEKLVYFLSFCQKKVAGDIKRWKMRNFHYHPKTTWPFPAPLGKENDGKPDFQGVVVFWHPLLSGRETAAACPEEAKETKTESVLRLRINTLLNGKKTEVWEGESGQKILKFLPRLEPGLRPYSVESTALQSPTELGDYMGEMPRNASQKAALDIK